jgi:hypothetical protein
MTRRLKSHCPCDQRHAAGRHSSPDQYQVHRWSSFLSFDCRLHNDAPGWETVHPISWRKEYGGLKTDQARRMKDLEKRTSGYAGRFRI